MTKPHEFVPHRPRGAGLVRLRLNEGTRCYEHGSGFYWPSWLLKADEAKKDAAGSTGKVRWQLTLDPRAYRVTELPLSRKRGPSNKDPLELRRSELGGYVLRVPLLNPLAETHIRMTVERIAPYGYRREPKRAGNHWRRILPTYLSRLCPVATPENDSIGISQQFARDVEIDGEGRLLAPYRDNRNRWHPRDRRPGEEIDRWIGERVPEENEKVLARCLHKDGTVEYAYKGRREIDYALVSPDQLLGLGASLVPFLHHSDAVRAIMGVKLLKEALPLLDPEPPLVATGLEDTVLEASPILMSLLRCPVEGTVSAITPFFLEITVPQGVAHVSLLAGAVPEKASAAIRLRPRVQVGQQVAAGEIIADGPGMRDRRLALGKNLLVAYLPFQGLNFEDGIVISESAAHKLTSVHVHTIELDHVRVCDVAGGKLKKGIVQPGQQVRGGEVVAVVQRSLRATPGGLKVPARERRANEQELQLLKEALEQGGSTGWSSEEEVCVPDEVGKGQIVRADCHDGRLHICIYEEKPARVGDKLTGRHGNKGVIARVLPDKDMPYFQVGDQTYRVEMILNPLSVVSRMNLGQLLETHWGWVLKHRDVEGGETIGRPFATARAEELQEMLKETGLDERGKAEIRDGMTGEPFHERVVVGYQYVVKLPQIADVGLSVRGQKGPRSLRTEQPVEGRRRRGGQRLGEMEGWALRSHGAYATLVEALGPKSDDLLAGLCLRLLTSLPERQDPQTLHTLRSLLRGALIDLRLPDFDKQRQADVRFIDAGKLRKQSNGEVMDPGPYDNIPHGLYSSQIFGFSRKDRRTRFGHIELAVPVLHPFLWSRICEALVEAIGNRSLAPSSSQRDIAKDLENYWLCDERDGEGRTGTEALLPLLESHGVRDELWRPYLVTVLPVIPPAYRWRKEDDDGQPLLDELGKAYERVVKANRLYKHVHDLSARDLTSSSEHDTGGAGPHKWVRWKVQGDKRLRQLREKGDVEALKKELKFLCYRFLHNAVRRLFGELRSRLDGKYGIFRYDLLGKRLDYSGRAIIVPAPDLLLNECYIPVDLVLPLFRVELTRRTKNDEVWTKVDRGDEQAIATVVAHLQRLLNERDIRVVLNRQPTLHRYNLLAFTPRIWREKAIGFPPLYCGPYNADFDGDSMALYLPVSEDAQAETRARLAVDRHLFSAASGNLLLHLTQDIVLGCYYLSLPSTKQHVELWKAQRREELAQILRVERTECSDLDRGRIRWLVEQLVRRCEDRGELLNRLHRLGELAFEAATHSGISLSFFDLKPLLIPGDQRETWLKRLNRLETKELEACLKRHLLADSAAAQNPLLLIYLSGARGGWEQVLQTIGLKGRCRDEKGGDIEAPPVFRNLYEGLSPFQYLLTCHSARRTLVDKKILVANAGSLTRELVESSGHVKIDPCVDDCGSSWGIPIPAGKALGRVVAKVAGAYGGHLVSTTTLARLRAEGGDHSWVTVRSPATCELSPSWVCRQCYGVSPATGEWAEPGEDIGIIAAQSIGERGTQLSMRTFHTGGMGEDLNLEWARRNLLSAWEEFEFEKFWQEIYTAGSPYGEIDPRHFETVFRARLDRHELSLRLRAAGDIAGDTQTRGFLSVAAYREAVGTLVEAATRELTDPLADAKAGILLNHLPTLQGGSPSG